MAASGSKRRRRAERVGDRRPGQRGEVGRERLDRRAVGVVGRARVAVRLPVPAEADRLHAHQVSRRHPRVAQPGGRHRPPSEVGDELALAAGVEPAGDVHDAGQRVVALPARPASIASPSWRTSAGGGSTVGTPPSRLRPLDVVAPMPCQRSPGSVCEVYCPARWKRRRSRSRARDGEQVFVYRWAGDGDPKAVVQIAHGMGEHAARYRRLGEALVDAGYVVYANDHRGHGRTAGSRRPAGRSRRGRLDRSRRRHGGADGAGPCRAPGHPARPARPQHGIVRPAAVPARPQRRHRRGGAVGNVGRRRHRRRHRHDPAGRPVGVQRPVRAGPY